MGEKNNLLGERRSVFLILGLALLGIIFMLSSALPGQGARIKTPAEPAEVMVPRRAEDDYRARLERDLAAALRRIRGVGEVVVLVTLESGPSYVYGENSEAVRRTTQEEDGGGGRRSIAEDTHRTQVVITRDGGTEKPLVSREIQPELRGVMVIAQGAADPHLREEIIRALQAGLNLPAHRVTVLPMK